MTQVIEECIDRLTEPDPDKKGRLNTELTSLNTNELTKKPALFVAASSLPSPENGNSSTTSLPG